MPKRSGARAPYAVPRYRAPDDAVWYHVLHGNVPGHQLDFMYSAEVPQGPLTQTHFGHLARLLKYIEPRERAPYAFALGNLSRDDVQHEPGHGGLAIIFGLRVEGVVDHVGRTMPSYAHGVVAIDRALDTITLLDAASMFHRRVLDDGAEQASQSFYRAYAHAVRHAPETVEELLRRYIAVFDALPRPRRSDLTWDWVADEASLPARITVVHDDDDSFGAIAHTAAKLGALLYRSNIKWTTISSGREFDIAGGLSIRFVRASEASVDPAGLVVPLDEVPDDEADIASMLFGAKPRGAAAPAARVGWRKQRAARQISSPDPDAAPPASAPAAILPATPSPPSPPIHASERSVDVGLAPKPRRHVWIGVGAGTASVCAIAALVAMTSSLSTRAPARDPTSSAVSSPASAASPPEMAPIDAPAPPAAATAAPPEGSGADTRSPATNNDAAPSAAVVPPPRPAKATPQRRLVQAPSPERPTPPAAGRTIAGEPKF